MTQSSALSGLTPRKHGEEKEDNLERTARLTTEILEDHRLSQKEFDVLDGRRQCAYQHDRQQNRGYQNRRPGPPPGGHGRSQIDPAERDGRARKVTDWQKLRRAGIGSPLRFSSHLRIPDSL